MECNGNMPNKLTELLNQQHKQGRTEKKLEDEVIQLQLKFNETNQALQDALKTDPIQHYRLINTARKMHDEAKEKLTQKKKELRTVRQRLKVLYDEIKQLKSGAAALVANARRQGLRF